MSMITDIAKRVRLNGDEEAATLILNLRAELAIRDGYLRRISRYVGANPDTLMWKEEAVKILEGSQIRPADSSTEILGPYRGFAGEIEGWDFKRQWRGRVDGVGVFSGWSREDAEQQFRDMIDEHLSACGKENERL